ncbi:MAG: ABC transporter ATP-binding protein [Candidatus Latescibacterota bacterium]|nr:MAG: ABC transporter ATP-binding protein [Candidatus Latescibacterota bacterium]
MATIQVQSVSHWYGEVIGLSNASFDVEPGVTGLLGPNGAGKSTLMRILTGQMRQSRGGVRILGESVWGNPDLFRRIGYCPELDSMYTELTGRQFLRLMLRLCGVRGMEADRKASDVLARVGLDPDLRKPIGAYSKGMRQRAKLAQALMLEAEVLLLDEPLNGMDPVGRKDTVDLIASLGQQGHTVLISSHILHEVEQMTAKIVLLHHGRVLAQGNVHEIRDHIEDQARSVLLRCVEPQRLAAQLLQSGEVTGVRFTRDPNALVVETASADAFFQRVTALGFSDGIEITEVQPLDDDLQSVFQYLVG